MEQNEPQYTEDLNMESCREEKNMKGNWKDSLRTLLDCNSSRMSGCNYHWELGIGRVERVANAWLTKAGRFSK